MNQFDLLKDTLRDYLDNGGEPADLVDAVTDVLAEIPGLEPVTEQLQDAAAMVLDLTPPDDSPHDAATATGMYDHF